MEEKLYNPPTKILIVDIDGTVSDCEHRREHALARDWDRFHEGMLDDSVIPSVSALLHLVYDDWPVIFLTGRPEEYRAETEQWLAERLQMDEDVGYHDLIMRPNNNFLTDSVLKVDLMGEMMADFNSPLSRVYIEKFLDSSIKDQKQWSHWLMDPTRDFKSDFIMLDDRDRVVEAFRNAGYTCWQVAMGAF